MNLKEMKNDILSNPEVLAEYDALKPEYEVVKAVLNARKYAHLTQQQLADKIGVDRADISKLENGNSNPTFAMLQRIASGLDMTLKLEFIPNATHN